MGLKYEIVATTGTYQKDGETKYKSKNVGAVITTKNGPRIKLDASFNPAGCPRDEDGQIWLALFDPKPRDNPNNAGYQGRGSQQTPPPADDNFEPDPSIPF